MEIKLKFNRNFNEIPLEIGISIGNPVEISIEIHWKSIWNSIDISMKYQWKSIGNPVAISMKYKFILLNYIEMLMEIHWKSSWNSIVNSIQWNTHRNPLEIQLKFNRKFNEIINGNSVEISMDY